MSINEQKLDTLKQRKAQLAQRDASSLFMPPDYIRPSHSGVTPSPRGHRTYLINN